VALDDLAAGARARVVRVSDEDGALLRYLGGLALRPGADVVLVERAPFDGPLTVAVDGAAVAVWGLTFKARTDDLRDSPAIEVIRRLQAQGASIKAYDPAIHDTREALEGIEVATDPYAVCEGADVLVVLTEWDEFRWMDFAKVAGLMRTAKIVDTRNLLEPAAIRRRGFTYDGLGRA